MDQFLVNEFQSFFRGADLEFGQHSFGEIKPGEKEKGGKNWTVKDTLLTDDQYRIHLEGGTGLGVIPINRENKCMFAVIDIDIYDGGSEALVIRAIMNNNLPLCVFRSKSGGYHIYLFFSDWTPANKAIDIVNRYVRLLSIDILGVKGREAIEIFPKQVVIKKGEIGNWINLPYWNMGAAGQVMLHEGRELTIQEALIIIKEYKRMPYKDHVGYLNTLEFNDAPPCLQSLYYLRSVEHNRNNFLFSFGVYFKKKDEDNFENLIYRMNQTLPEPLDERELENSIIQSIRKKGYGYRCNESPCVTVCNKGECKRREYGVGDGGFVSDLEFGQLYKIDIDPPYYEWEINGKRLRFKEEDEILNQNMFRKKCMRDLHYTPYKLKDGEWIKILNDALASIKIEEQAEAHHQISVKGMLYDYFFEFMSGQGHVAQTKSQINMGRCFLDREIGVYYFRGADLMDFLYNKKQFKAYTPSEIHGLLRDAGAESKKIRISGEPVRVFALKETFFRDLGYNKPDLPPEVSFTPDEIQQQIDNMETPF